ncbi:zinc finger protein [Histomonas meleagridis]|uniref:zinc finger protein n=1 Tax=Histomonas meleagridis TaxID=135588 RepID=UPI00355950C7|nr:zinc finger protein [Histomonas meleagridis]KAH0796835.1 zinc finger protein [Histomonas meleagridis]
MLPSYLQDWRIHSPPLIEAKIYGSVKQTIDPTSPEEKSLRRLLHKMLLDRTMAQHEYERTTKIDNIPCLFCKDSFSGTWHQYLQWLFEVHRFNPGRPQNLVYIEDLINHLRSKINSNRCIHCDQHFDKPHLLRAHMKKKPHDKIPDSRYYDKFYMVNYLEEGKKWQDIAQDGDAEGGPESIEEGLKDFGDLSEGEETKCLICDLVSFSPRETIMHMRRYHGFYMNEIKNAVGGDFYKLVRFVNYARKMKNEKRCFVCAQPVLGNYAEHIHLHDSKVPNNLPQFVDDKELLIPVIPSDPLLTVLEDFD